MFSTAISPIQAFLSGEALQLIDLERKAATANEPGSRRYVYEQ